MLSALQQRQGQRTARIQIVLQPMSGDRFTAPFTCSDFALKSRHFYPLLEVYKSITGWHYDGMKRVWDFPKASLDDFKAAIAESSIPADVSDRHVRGPAEFQIRIQQHPNNEFKVTVWKYSRDWQRWTSGAFCPTLPSVFRQFGDLYGEYRQFGDRFGKSDWDNVERVWTFYPSDRLPEFKSAVEGCEADVDIVMIDPNPIARKVSGPRALPASMSQPSPSVMPSTPIQPCCGPSGAQGRDRSATSQADRCQAATPLAATPATAATAAATQPSQSGCMSQATQPCMGTPMPSTPHRAPKSKRSAPVAASPVVDLTRISMAMPARVDSTPVPAAKRQKKSSSSPHSLSQGQSAAAAAAAASSQLMPPVSNGPVRYISVESASKPISQRELHGRPGAQRPVKEECDLADKEASLDCSESTTQEAEQGAAGAKQEAEVATQEAEQLRIGAWVQSQAGHQDVVKQRMRTCLEPYPWNRLRQFQQEGVEACLRRGGRCLLADEMGCGKTVQAIAVAACYTEDWPLLVITPSIMRLTWAEALMTWLPPHFKPSILNVATGQDIKKHGDILQRPAQTQIVIISYDLVQKMGDLAKRFPFIICDESHALKGLMTKRTKFVVPLVQRARRALLLSGTPALSRPIELFPQIDALYRGLVGGYYEFGLKYCGGPPIEIRPGVRVFRGCSSKEELAALLKEKLMIRRLKKDVLKQLPAKNRRNIPITPDSASLKEVRKLQKEQAQLNTLEESPAKKCEGHRIIDALYEASGQAKHGEVLKHIISLQEAGQKQLVFAYHKSVLDLLEEGLKKQKLKYIRIDGTTPDAARQKAVAKFQNQKSTDIALLAIMAANVGLTLTAASVVVFAELAWVPGVLIQAEDRAHRIGQEKCVEVLYLRAKGTIDDVMWRNVNTKQSNVGNILDGHDEGTAQGLAFTPSEGCPAFTAAPGPSQMGPLHEVTSSVLDMPRCGKAEMQMAGAPDPADLATPPQKERKRPPACRKDTGAENIKSEEDAYAGSSQTFQPRPEARFKQEADAIDLTALPLPRVKCGKRLFKAGGADMPAPVEDKEIIDVDV